MSKNILPIIEGHSEVDAIPVLIRRLLMDLDAPDVQCLKPWRIKRDQVVNGESVLRDKIRAALMDRENVGAIVVLLDAEDDCPMELVRMLKKRCKVLQNIPPLSIIIAKRKLECWFLGAKESIQGVRGIRVDVTTPMNPESLGIGRLEKNMKEGYFYHKVDDSPAFAARLDIKTARKNCPSFDKFVREIKRLAESCKEIENKKP